MTTTWTVSDYTTCNPPEKGNSDSDDGRLAWRILHTPTNKCAPIPFQRKRDAERAADLMNKKCPAKKARCDDEMIKAIKNKFGTMKKWYYELITECCAW